MKMPREIVTLKSALDELLAAHDEFDAASFYGSMGELHVAQMKVDAARRRARLISGRFDHALDQYSTLEKLIEAGEHTELERNTRLND